LVRTDGKPLYHLATIVDDHDQAITHVVRGEEWLSSLPIHAYLYRLLGWPEPVWVHLPLVLNQERQRLSKRDPEGGYLVQDFQEAGYLPAALFNYLLLLGWSPDGEQEIISKWEARRQFRLERLNKAAAIFDWDKAKWVNRQYMKKLSNSELAQQIHPHLEDWYESLPASDDWLLRLAALIREEISLFSEAPAAASWAFEAGFEYTDAANKSLSDEAARPVLIRLIAELAQLVLLDTSTADRILKRMRQDFKELAGLSASQVMQPLRAALTGKLDGPPLPEIMALLGSARCMERLASAHKRATV
jgi:nondiscriminating glutamyl-tRNA synthetase